MSRNLQDVLNKLIGNTNGKPRKQPLEYTREAIHERLMRNASGIQSKCISDDWDKCIQCGGRINSHLRKKPKECPIFRDLIKYQAEHVK
jgi:hypothetical protein